MTKSSKTTGTRSKAAGAAWLTLLLVLLTIGMLRFQDSSARPNSTEISYTTFRREVDRGNVESIVVAGGRIEGRFRDPAPPAAPDEGDPRPRTFSTRYPAFGDDGLFEELDAHGVDVTVASDRAITWWTLLLGLSPVLMLILLFFLVSRGLSAQGKGLLSMGRSRARLYNRREKKERETFQDVAGTQEAKRELQEIVEFLRDPNRVSRVGGEMPRGVLLVGPPGTGKTLLARAVAGEADVPFFSITGSDFMEMFVGVGASRVRELFSAAKAQAPSIVFIDELDSVGRHRGAGIIGGHDEREQTLNQLLSEMDGFEPNVGVVVIAATNRPDVLDRALLRPGRFDRRIAVDLPTLRDRVDILRVHSRAKPLSPEVDFEEIARSTAGFSGADLKNLLNEAALLVARRDGSVITPADIELARDKVVMGLKREDLTLSRDELELLAYHEAGHAVVAAVLPLADPLRKVTIVPRARTMGHTEQIPAMDRFVYHRDYLLDRLAVMLGGRAAEELFKKTATSGAESDLKQATALARSMVLDWGMGDRLPAVAFGQEGQPFTFGFEIGTRRDVSDQTARELDEETMSILSHARGRALKVLQEERRAVGRLVELLLEKEEVLGDEVLEVLERRPRPLKSWSGTR
jgi:cell division protease FtsH